VTGSVSYTSVGLTTPVARALLRLGPEAPAGLGAAIAQRLADAIRLGILLDGERLPPEARLAEQLGVSTVTLRESLAILRARKLVVTRRGRGGGTFVAAPDHTRDLGSQLRALTAGQLRDLGDQRAAISGTAARLAAERAVPAEIDGLRRQLARFADAASASQRRRAATLFALMVAAAAQSPRLVAEEFRLTAEVGDLLWMDVGDAEHADAVRARAGLADAIGAGDGRLARDLAETVTRHETRRLIALHLRASEPGQQPLALDDKLAGLMADLQELAAQFARLSQPACTDDLAGLRGAIFAILDRHRGLACGAGLITAPGALADARLWLEWWLAPSEPLRVNLDPAAPDFYDYTIAQWYSAAESSGQPQFVGPYVDHFCTGDYTITLSVPVRTGDRFLGVAAADILVASLERGLLPALLAAGSVLTSADGRIIASPSPDAPPGTRTTPGPEVLPSTAWHLSPVTGYN
jgi:DNA-binding FadR family transcriptional regulator